MLQCMKTVRIKANDTKNSPNTTHSRQSCKTLVSTDASHCYHCKGSHFISSCPTFFKLPVKSQIDEARKQHLCLNCLKKDTIHANVEVK